MKILVVKGLEFLLDDDVYERIKGYRWGVISKKYGTRKINSKVGRITFMLHWEVIGAPPIGLTVDHVDGNTFNNQRSNLRFATQRQQRCNSEARSHKEYKGVHRNKNKSRPWCARIGINGKFFHLGVFATPEAASAAYFEAAKKLFGEFASK